MPTPDELRADLAGALSALQHKQNETAYYLSYYDGQSPLPQLAERLKKIYANLNTEFRQNWCAPVIDACADRITLTGISMPDEGLQAAFDRIAISSDLLLEADDVHKHALIVGQGYIIVWQDPETEEIEVFYNPANICHICYHKENPNRKRYAAKWWHDEGYLYVKLYYPDALYTFVTECGEDKTNTIKAGAFSLTEDGEQENPHGVIPVWEFRPDRRGTISDIRDVIPMNDAINATFINMLVVGEYNAFRQKYIISSGDIAGALRVAPDTILDIPASDGMGQDTEVGEFSETNMENYAKINDSIISAVGAITRTPMHYFFKAGGQPSGEALIALEAPLNKKASDRIARFTPAWRQIGAFIAKLLGYTVAPEDITPQFERPETVQPLTQSTIRVNNAKAGIPVTSTLRMEGQPQSVIDDVATETAAQSSATADSMARAFNAGADAPVV